MRFDRPTFVSLLVGHVIFLALAAAAGPLSGFLFTPIFVLPMLIVRRRSGLLGREILVFAVLMTGVHYLAVRQAIGLEVPLTSVWPNLPEDWLAGGSAGLIGSAATFALIALFRLARPELRTAAILLIGTVLLTGLGAVGVATAGAMTGWEGIVGNLIFCLLVYTPWQIAFAAILALVLHPARPAIEARTLVGRG